MCVPVALTMKARNNWQNGVTLGQASPPPAPVVTLFSLPATLCRSHLGSPGPPRPHLSTAMSQ
jgi:hypothetical protein